MAVVSDFDVVTKFGFVRARDGIYVFHTGGHVGNWPGLLDCSLLGGFRADDPYQALSVRFWVNEILVGSRSVRRWLQPVLVYDRILIPLEPGVLDHPDRSPFASPATNVLRIEPYWRGSSDHLFVGPIVCHFKQEA